MKQIISALAIGSIALMASCSSTELKEKEIALKMQQNTIDSMKMEMAKKQIVDSMNEMNRMQFTIPQVVEPAAVAAVAAAPVRKAVTRKSSARRSSSSRSASTSGYSSGSYAGNSSSAAPVYQEAPVVAPQKRGWSAKAKGAVIGAGTGAAAGAIINKRNRVAGAVIGGVLGAGAGTGIGAIIDKKNGR
ncbi:MAG: glycine zipper 2TM domain-containing protein [Sphingobacteriales bacterium]|nr:MAG: glycine zipper 2TM domain-containing protein [Sphingobacteriales bacterium]